MFCDKRFNQKNNLTTHTRTHSSTSPIPCTVCGIQCPNSVELLNHMRLHNDEKPFVCQNVGCNKVFLQFAEFAEHLKQHVAQKPFKCDICGKQFSQSNNLKTHIKTHLFQDPFKCSLCSRSFQNSDEFTLHMRIHNTDKPYECTYCGKRFIQSNNLKVCAILLLKDFFLNFCLVISDSCENAYRGKAIFLYRMWKKIQPEKQFGMFYQEKFKLIIGPLVQASCGSIVKYFI
jgi:uncharacterized Zn-finger protein